MKSLGLDIGDTWIGIALSDSMGITCKPHSTITLENLPSFIEQIVPQENITTIVMGNPITLKGTHSAQTKKVIALKELYASRYSSIGNNTINWVLWDERLSSKRAQAVQKKGDFSKEAKRKEHAIAAAFILQNYLDNQAFQTSFS